MSKKDEGVAVSVVRNIDDIKCLCGEKALVREHKKLQGRECYRLRCIMCLRIYRPDMALEPLAEGRWIHV